MSENPDHHRWPPLPPPSRMLPTPRRPAVLPAVLLAAALALVPAAAAPAQGADGLAVSGRLAGDGGAPLAGARAELWPVLSPLEMDRLLLAGRLRPEPAATATTGRDGTFRLAAPGAGFWRLRLEAPGRVPLEVPLAPLFEPVDVGAVELPAAVELAVTVTGDDGAPVAGALLVAVPEREARPPRRPWFAPEREAVPAPRLAFTDVAGRATLPRGAGEALEIELLAPGRPLHAERLAAGAGAARLALRPPPGTPRRLRVLDPRGEPAAGAVVEVGRFGLPAAVVGEDGLATVAVPVAGGTIKARGDGGARARAELATPDPAADSGTGEPAPVTLRLLPPLEIAGRVLGADGDPLPGALLWTPGTDPRRAVAGARGEFRLGIDASSLTAGLGTRVIVAAAAPGHLPAFEALQLPLDPEGATLRLTAAARLAGRVVDGDGEPVPGAAVVAWPSPGGGFRSWMAAGPSEAETGAAGEFALARLRPGGAYLLTVEHPGFGPLEAAATAPAAGAAAEPLELVLPPAVAVRGRVLDAADAPVPGARVTLRRAEPASRAGRPRFLRFGGGDEPPGATTAADGSFAVPGLAAGRYDVDAEAPGYAPLRVPGVEVPELAEVDLGTLYLAPGAELAGRVVDAGGRPLEGAAVSVQQDDPVERRAWRDHAAPKPRSLTGRDGRFTADGLTAGVPATVTVEREGYARRVLQAVPVPADEPLEIELLPASRLAGRVVGPGGEGVAHATVLAHVVPEPQRPTFGAAHATAEDDGSFALAEVPPGEVVVSARAPGFLPREMPPLRLAPGEERTGLRVALERAAVVTGRVSGPGGEPLDGAYARVEGEHRSPGSATDADGRYRLDEVPPGPVAVRFEHHAHLGATRELEVSAGGEHRLDVTLERGGELTGRVIGPDGEPAAGAWVQLLPGTGARGSRGWPSRDVVGADGAFRLVGIEPGRYRVAASKEGFSTAESEEIEVAPGGASPSIELRLERGAAIVGRVLGVELADLARVEVRAVGSLPGQAGGLGGGVGGVVSHDGTYRIEGVAPGSWQVVAELGSSQAAAVEPVEVAPGQTEVHRDLDLGAGHTLTGRVTLDAEPLPGATVMVMGLDRSRGAHATTDPSGRFVVRGLQDGTYRVSLESGSVTERREVEIAGDRDVELALVSGGIEGTVSDAGTGAPVEGAEVFLVRRDERAAATAGSRRTDSGGGYRFPQVPSGSYEVRVQAEGYVAGTATVEVAPGAASRADLRLEPGEGLVLALTTPAGAFRGFARVAAFDAAALDAAAAGGAAAVRPVAAEALAGGGGRGRLRLPAGRWRLLVAASGHGTTAADAAVPGPPVTVALPPGGDLLVSVPALAEGFERGEVRLRGADGRLLLGLDGDGRAVTARPLSFGRAFVTSVPAGPWTVEATAPDGRTWTGTATVAPGVRSELTLQ